MTNNFPCHFHNDDKKTRDSGGTEAVIDEKTCFCAIDKVFWAGDALFPVIHYAVQFVHTVLRNALRVLQTLIVI